MTTETTQLDLPALTQEPRKANLYLRLWRGVPRELGFLLLTLPIATAGFGLGIALLSGGAGTIVMVFVGLFLIIGGFYVSRAFGTLELIRLEWAGRPAVARPQWVTQPGFWGWLRSMFSNGHYWLYLLHTALVNYVVSVVTWTITVVWLGLGLGGITLWMWSWLIPRGDRTSSYVSELIFRDSAIDFRLFDNVLFAILGVVMVVTLPFITHGLVLIHHAIAKGMLSAFPSDSLKSQLRDASDSRGAAASAEGQALRRLERDIHDGPQQRLVRMQMDLSAAERQFDSDPEGARALLAEAKVRSQETLDELRALSRGFAPPILLDRGLVAALESLASRSSVSVTVSSSLDEATSIPQEIERNAYFVASELVTNAVKHSGAAAIDVAVTVRQAEGTDASWLDVSVTESGSGGAAFIAGHGLAGLEERLRGLGGTLEVSSPVGGPTAIVGHLPVTF